MCNFSKGLGKANPGVLGQLDSRGRREREGGDDRGRGSDVGNENVLRPLPHHHFVMLSQEIHLDQLATEFHGDAIAASCPAEEVRGGGARVPARPAHVGPRQ